MRRGRAHQPARDGQAVRVAALVFGCAALGCNTLTGLDGLEKADCVENCGGAAGSGALAPEGVSVGRNSSCVLMTDKSVRCWGAHPGVAPGTVKTTPIKVATLADIDGLSIGLGHSCAVDGSGTVFCWGQNEHGQLGDGTTTPSPEPKAVPGLPSIDTVIAGAAHSCAYTSPDVEPVQAFCWGQNDSGQLGDGTTTDSPNPVKLVLPVTAKIVRMSPGTGFTPAIVDVAGVLETWCWGRNDKGQCGLSTSQAVVATPTKIPGVPQLERVYGGSEHVCGRTAGTKLPWCWGANEHGQVGVNKSSPSEPPTAVIGGVAVDTMYVGARHSCLMTNSSVEGRCWGANDFGQFGGPPSTDVLMPSDAPYLNGAATMMRQAEHGCRILDDVVTCFGANDSGQLGNGKTEPFSAPVVVDLGL
ncbi:MAG: hypothetical protein HYZ29_09640 [Myxococcales bacterium]|nr:hypothetical protein [Myxococcales bacterium]